MKLLLRSCFKGAGDEEAHVLQNIVRMRESGLGFEQETDIVLWEFVADFVGKYHHSPTIADLRTYFGSINSEEVVNRIEYLGSLRPRAQGGFLLYLEQKAEERRKIRVRDILSEAGNILTTGVKIQEKGEREPTLLKGPREAISYVLDQSREIIAPTTGHTLSGTVNEDVEDFLEEYRRARDDPSSGKGCATGIEQIDEFLPGAKPHELWIHAAFTGGMKSTFIINWAYNLSVGLYGQPGKNPCESSVIFSLEMPYHQVRRMVFVMHSTHPKWIEQGIPPLDYQRVRDGELSEIEEAHLETVARDYASPDNQYGRVHVEVMNPDNPDFRVADVKAKSELHYAKSPFGVIFVDHVGLMAPRRWVPSTTERLNEVVRDLKRLAMSFNRGQGIGVVALFQINREGYKGALKQLESARKKGNEEALHRGKYNLTSLSYANEAERSADVITATWIDDELRQKNRVQFQCLKTRDQQPFEPFYAQVSWKQRRLYTLHNLTTEEAMTAGEEIDVDDMLEDVF
jgi:hypothetical protein